MLKKEYKTPDIRNKILTSGLSKMDLLKFKHIFKKFKEVYNEKITKKTNLQESIAFFAIDSIKSISTTLIFVCVFLSLSIYFKKAILLASLICLVITIYIIYNNAKDKEIKFTTELKLIFLGLKLLF